MSSRKAAATARIGEVWYYIKLCGATRLRALKVAGRRAREKKTKVSFLSYLFSSLVPKIDPSTLAKRLCEMKRDPEWGGEGGRVRIPRDRIRGKIWKEGEGAWTRTKISFRFLVLDGSIIFPIRNECGGENRNEPWEYSLDETDSDFHYVSSFIFKFTRDDFRNNLYNV